MAQHEHRVLWRNVSLPPFYHVQTSLTISYSHVARTGDIKQFVVIEESGIAKGTRRIIAVTGHEAQEVTRQAETLRERLHQVEKTGGQHEGYRPQDLDRRPCSSALGAVEKC